jgi:hypothetical protein
MFSARAHACASALSMNVCALFCTTLDQLFGLFGPDQDELAYPAHHMALETTPRNHGSELSSSTMIQQMAVVADLTTPNHSCKNALGSSTCIARRFIAAHPFVCLVTPQPEFGMLIRFKPSPLAGDRGEGSSDEKQNAEDGQHHEPPYASTRPVIEHSRARGYQDNDDAYGTSELLGGTKSMHHKGHGTGCGVIYRTKRILAQSTSNLGP